MAAAARASGGGAENAFDFVDVAKSYIGDHATALIQDCVQMHGGIGVTWDHDLHLYLRRVAQDRCLYGTPGRTPRPHRNSTRTGGDDVDGHRRTTTQE